MNVIVSNKQKEIIDNANIDAIKDLNGLFNVTDLINKFKNYFFSKMILDATSVENFASRDVLTQLVDGIGADRLIILLPQNPPPPDEFKKLLIDLRIYNFSNNIDDVVKFIDNPNTYENVIGAIDNIGTNDTGYIDNSIKGNTSTSGDDMFNPNITENNVIKEENSVLPVDNNKSDLHMSLENLLNNSNVELTDNSDNAEKENRYEEYSENKPDSEKNVQVEEKSNVEEEHVFKVDDKKIDDELKNERSSFHEDTNSSTNKREFVFLNMNGFDKIEESSKDKKIIGFKNVTLHAGSTSLIYMLLKATIETLKKDAIAIEINKNEFRLFLNKKMISVNEKEAIDFIKSRSESVIFVDLNDCDNCDFCDEIIYLVEPSIIMLNRLMSENRDIFKTLSDKKVVLNKCMLSKDDINILSDEANVKFVYSFGPLNDRVNNDEILSFLDILDIKC